MGTHPIFESDFDCLTGMLSRTLIRRVHLSRPVLVAPFNTPSPTSLFNGRNQTHTRAKVKVVIEVFHPKNAHPMLLKSMVDGDLLKAVAVKLLLSSTTSNFCVGSPHFTLACTLPTVWVFSANTVTSPSKSLLSALFYYLLLISN